MINHVSLSLPTLPILALPPPFTLQNGHRKKEKKGGGTRNSVVPLVIQKTGLPPRPSAIKIYFKKIYHTETCLL